MYEELREVGLSENETQTYVTLLKTGISTANRVAEITGIKRSTVYDTLNQLINKGIVSKIVREEVHYYEAAQPEKLIYLLDERKERIKQIIPKLKSIQESTTEKTGVTYFEGKKGVLTVLNDIIEQNKELWFYGSRTAAKTALAHYPDNFIYKRAENKIFLKAILAEEDREHPAYNDKKIIKLSNLKFSKDLNNISANVFIYSNRVAFMTSGENPVGIIIKNKEILQQQRGIFEILWKNAKK